MMGFNLRHEPTLKKLKKIVDNGDLGKIFLIENREFYSGGRTYMSRWNRKYERSGGLWVHKGSHDFDVFNWLLGFPMPVKVSAFAGVDVLKRENIPFQLKNGIEPGPTCGACHYRDICPDLYRQSLPPEWSAEAVRFDNYSPDLCMYCSDKDTHDNGIAIVEYENGAKASHMECFITPFGDRRYTVMGDRGIAEVSLVKRTIEVHPRWTSETISYNLPQAVGSHGGADPVLLDSFIKTVRGEIPLSSTIEQGMRSTAIGQAAEISRRESRTVFIDELIKQQT
jgi:predicted dehydrogenase